MPESTPRGLLPAGSTIGISGAPVAIVRSSDTAYLVEDEIGSYWISFDAVHGRPAAASPLVVFA